MINVSPIGRNASIEERNDYEKYDKQHNIRPKFVEALKNEFSDYGLTYVFLTSSPLANLVPQLVRQMHLNGRANIRLPTATQ